MNESSVTGDAKNIKEGRHKGHKGQTFVRKRTDLPGRLGVGAKTRFYPIVLSKAKRERKYGTFLRNLSLGTGRVEEIL